MSLETPLNRDTIPTNKKRRSPIPPSAEVVDVEAFSFINNGTDLHRAIAASLGLPNIIELSDDEDDDDVRILKFKPQNTAFGKRRNTNSAEIGESSNSAPFVCEICTETKTTKDSFAINGCSHAYCSECVALYVGSKLQENVINIRCPETGCRGLLEAEDCRTILPPQVFDRWGKALCEAVITASEKFYCPFGDCAALLIRDGEVDKAVTESECPNCRRLFCAQCNVPWHSGIKCEDFQKLNKDEREMEDIMLMQFADKMKWMRCPNCKFFVGKSEGCMYMKCRCGCAFCYNCGAKYSNHSSHYCSKCKK